MILLENSTLEGRAPSKRGWAFHGPYPSYREASTRHSVHIRASRGSGLSAGFCEVRLEVLWPIWCFLDLAILLLKASRLSALLTRALELVWGAIFGHFREKCLRLLNFQISHLRNFEFKVWISYQKISYQKRRVYLKQAEWIAAFSLTKLVRNSRPQRHGLPTDRVRNTSTFVAFLVLILLLVLPVGVRLDWGGVLLII